MTKNYIGKSTCGELVFQEIKDGVIRGFTTAYPVELVDGETVLSMSSWCHSVELESGLIVKSGFGAVPTLSLPEEYDGCYTCDTVSCEVCSSAHDSDNCIGYSSDPTWTIVNECEAICLGCRTAEQVMVPLTNASDLFKAKNLEGVSLDDFEEIDTLFCDSSGFGSDGERALTKSQAIKEAESIISDSNSPLYVGLTGIGQYQVYVTIFKKSASKQSA